MNIGEVLLKITTQMSRQQTGLKVRQQADGRLLDQQRMVRFLLLALLPGRHHLFAPFFIQINGAARTRLEMFNRYLFAVDERDR